MIMFMMIQTADSFLCEGHASGIAYLRFSIFTNYIKGESSDYRQTVPTIWGCEAVSIFDTKVKSRYQICVPIDVYSFSSKLFFVSNAPTKVILGDGLQWNTQYSCIDSLFQQGRFVADVLCS